MNRAAVPPSSPYPRPVGSFEKGRVVPVSSTAPFGVICHRFTPWYPAPVVSSTSESAISNLPDLEPDGGRYTIPEGSGLGGLNPDVGIVWTSWGMTVGGGTAAAGSARPVTIPQATTGSTA